MVVDRGNGHGDDYVVFRADGHHGVVFRSGGGEVVDKGLWFRKSNYTSLFFPSKKPNVSHPLSFHLTSETVSRVSVVAMLMEEIRLLLVAMSMEEIHMLLRLDIKWDHESAQFFMIGIDGEFSEDSANWMKKNGSGRLPAVVTTGGTDLKQAIEALNDDNSGDVGEWASQKNLKPLKAKTTKAERRALQEPQRAAKASAKAAAFHPYLNLAEGGHRSYATCQRYGVYPHHLYQY